MHGRDSVAHYVVSGRILRMRNCFRLKLRVRAAADRTGRTPRFGMRASDLRRALKNFDLLLFVMVLDTWRVFLGGAFRELTASFGI